MGLKLKKKAKDKWDNNMSDEDFEKASIPYFEKQIWTLHISICLLQKINPETKIPAVGESILQHKDGVSECDDDTDRPFKIAMEAIDAAKNGDSLKLYNIIPLPIVSADWAPKSAKDIIVNPRSFIKWAMKRWPKGCSHLKSAEKAYQKQKKGTKAGTDEEKRIQAFVELLAGLKNEKEVEELGGKYKIVSIRGLAKELERKIKDTSYSLSWETLRCKNRVPTWYIQHGYKGKNLYLKIPKKKL